MAEGINTDDVISAVTELLGVWQELGDLTRPLLQ